MRLKIVIHSGESPERLCRAKVPVLPGRDSESDTPAEALANSREAIASYFDASEPAHSSTEERLEGRT